jgi:hypothetical protein
MGDVVEMSRNEVSFEIGDSDKNDESMADTGIQSERDIKDRHQPVDQDQDDSFQGMEI